MHHRAQRLKSWLLATLTESDWSLHALTGDASFRRYFRVLCAHTTYIVMDAPPDKEQLDSFIAVNQLLIKHGVPTLTIIAHNHSEGFLLLSDLGNELLLNNLHANTASVYYQQAMDILITMQRCFNPSLKMPIFDYAFMMQEMSLFPEWFLKHYLGLDLQPSEQQALQHAMHWLAGELTHCPLTFIHRDFHSRNLMVTNTQGPELAVIDFQDAMYGPIAYDLVSLLKDCYIEWPRNQIVEWANYYYQQLMLVDYSFADFMDDFDLCGIQRHLKVLGIFCRLHLRDGKPDYLQALPRVLRYLCDSCMHYPKLQPLYRLLNDGVAL